MEPNSPPTERVLGILQLFASRPYEAWSLTDLARQLGLTRATGHAIVSTLVRGGFLTRHPVTKTFTLGPALIAVGRAAETAYPEIAHAFAEIEELTKPRGISCSITAVVSGEIVVLARCGDAASDAIAPRVGQRIPFVAPYGSSFLVGAPDEELEAWLERAPASTPLEQKEQYRERVRSVAERGYGIDQLTEPQARLRQLLVEIQADPLEADLEAQVRQLAQELQRRDEAGEMAPVERDGMRPMSELFAPVPGCGLALNMHFSQRLLSQSELEDHIERLLAATARIAEASPKHATGTARAQSDGRTE